MSDTKTEPKRGNPLVMWIFAVFIIVVIAMMCTPVMMRCNKKAAMTEATSNAKQIFYLLIEFDEDYRRFPTDATAVDQLAGYQGKYSNDYLAQLIQGGYTKSEEIFYANGGSSRGKRPDNVITSRDDQLSEGECGFAYIKDLDVTANGKTPVLLAPMYGDGYRFNTDIYKGKAVTLRVDGAVKQLLLNKDRHAKLGPEKTLFDAGPDSVWGVEGFDKTKLCYAKKTYRFTPGLKRSISSQDWLQVSIVVILLIVIGRVFYRGFKNRDGDQSGIATSDRRDSMEA